MATTLKQWINMHGNALKPPKMNPQPAGQRRKTQGASSEQVEVVRSYLS